MASNAVPDMPDKKVELLVLETKLRSLKVNNNG